MKVPLKKARVDFSFKSAVFDYAAIRKAAAPNPFGIVPDKEEAAKPVANGWVCDASLCYRWSDGTGNYYGQCSNQCGVG